MTEATGLPECGQKAVRLAYFPGEPPMTLCGYHLQLYEQLVLAQGKHLASDKCRAGSLCVSSKPVKLLSEQVKTERLNQAAANARRFNDGS